MELQLDMLKNGVRLAVMEMPESPGVTFNFYYRNGARFEAVRDSGLTHFMEHIYFHGSDKVQSQEFIDRARSIGTQYNGATGYEMVNYHIRSRWQNQEPALKLLLEILSKPAFSPESLTHEKEVVTDEIKSHLTDIQNFFLMELGKKFYGNHPFSRMIGGTVENVQRFTPEDIERHAGTFNTSNLWVCVAGNTTMNKVKEIFEPHLDFFRTGYEPQCIPTPQPPGGTHVVLKEANYQQTFFELTYPSFSSRDSRRFTMKLAELIMRWNLGDEIRSKQSMLYDIRARSTLLEDSGQFVLFGGVAGNRLVRTLELSAGEMEKLASNGDGVQQEKKLGQAKEAVRTMNALEPESDEELANRIGSSLTTFGRYISRDEGMAKIEAVTMDDVRQSMRHILDRQTRAVIAIGDHPPAQELAAVFVAGR